MDNYLSQVFIAVKRHGNSYKGKDLLGLVYSFRSLVYYHNGQEKWWHLGRHGAREGVESSTS